MGQLSALIYKNAALTIRQRKSLVIQTIATLLLLAAAGISILALTILTSDYYYNNYAYEPAYNPDFEQSRAATGGYCYPADDFPQICGPALWGIFAQPESGDSPGVLTNTSYLTGDKSGLLGRIRQYTYPDNYGYSSADLILPAFGEVAASDITNYVVDAMSRANSLNYNNYSRYWQVPTSAITFNTIDYSDGSIDYTIEANTNDVYYPEPYPDFYRQDVPVKMQQLISQSFIAESLGHNFTFFGEHVYLANQYWESDYDITPLVEFILVTPSLMLILPMFVFSVVNEKQNKTLELNKLMGMKMWLYWLSYLIFDAILYGIVMLAAFITCLAFLLKCIWSSFAVTVILWIFWGFAQIGMGLFISAVVSNERAAIFVSYLTVFFSLILGYPINLFLFSNTYASWWYIWFPPWTYIRGFFLIENSFVNGPKLSLVSMTPEMWWVYGLLLLQGVGLTVAAIYLEQILPRSWGKRKPFYFPISELYHKIKPTKRDQTMDDGVLASERTNFSLIVDPDIKREEEIALNPADPSKYVLRCGHMRKEYDKEKVALGDVSLAVEYEEAFGLLGPNGAGKTTLLSILSGMIRPSSGFALIDGRDIISESDYLRTTIGICPQFDILWDDLTVNEHFRFYYRMKGLTKGQKMHVLVHEMADRVGLSEHLNKPSKDLSGGMKRKLSIGIAMIGDPKLVMLDEPSSGLDPEARREIWDIISSARKGRSFIITTHNMEEADVLCTRIGILSKGNLACLGTQQHLKNKYGKGYSLTVTTAPGAQPEQVHAELMKVLPDIKLDHSYATTLNYVIYQENFNISEVFSKMREHRHRIGIHEFAVSQTSLEEVFLRILELGEGENSSYGVV